MYTSRTAQASRSISTRQLQDHAGRSAWHMPFMAVELLLLVLGVALAAVVRNVKGPLPGDVGLILGVQHLILPHQLLTNVISFVSTINWPVPAGATVAVIVVGLLLLRRWLDALTAFSVSALADLGSYLTNQVVQRPRPEAPGLYVQQQINTYWSFPSGHVIHMIAFFGFLLFLTFQVRRPAQWLWLPRIVLSAFILLMPISRLVQGEHWPTDVLGSIFFGSFWLILAIHVYSWLAQRFPRLRGSAGQIL